MTRLAILDDVLPSQIAGRTGELAPIELVWSGTDASRLAAEGPSLGLSVLALSFELLGGEEHAARRARELGDATGAELLLSLGAFEDYAAACQSRSPEDARIHGLLHRSTAAARRLMEDALVELLRHENVVL